MASIKCSKCGDGIHYHSIPMGIEYTFISDNLWDEMCNSKFDESNFEMDSSGIYPKLYRTDTIETDFEGELLKLWKCPLCGSFHMFDETGHVIKVLSRTNDCNMNGANTTGLMFDDYLWDDITGKSLPNNALNEVQPTYYASIGEDYIILYYDSEQKTIIDAYNKLDIVSNDIGNNHDYN